MNFFNVFIQYFAWVCEHPHDLIVVLFLLYPCKFCHVAIYNSSIEKSWLYLACLNIYQHVILYLCLSLSHYLSLSLSLSLSLVKAHRSIIILSATIQYPQGIRF